MARVSNPKLVSLEGLSSLREVSVWLSILRNHSLQTIGLRQLETADYIQVGYAKCVGVGPPEGSQGNGMVEFDGFDSLVEFEYMRISEMSLTSNALPVLGARLSKRILTRRVPCRRQVRG
jgi:hypothetical protein